MPKLKTRKSISKRLKVTKKKKMLKSKGGRRHLLSGKKTKRKRHLRRKGLVAGVDMKSIKKAMPYSL